MTAWHPRASVTPRILLLGASPGDADAIVAAFAHAGHAVSCDRVATRRGLTEALRNGACDAVVVDCGLRRLDVLKAIAGVVRGDADLPVVAVSAELDDLALDIMRAGAADYLLKADLDRLPAVLLREMRRADERRELRGVRTRLSASERRFRTLAEATNQIVWTLGPDCEADGPIDDWTAFTGQTAAEFHGLGWLDVVHPDDRERAVADWRKAADEGAPYRSEYRLKRLGDGYRWMSSRAVPLRDDDGAIVQWIGADRDVTDHLRVVRDLATAKDYNARVMAISPAFFCAVGADGRIDAMNQAMLLHLGHKLDDVVGIEFGDLLVGGQQQIAEIWRSLSGNESITRELHMLAADGRELLVEWRAAPVFAADGAFDHAVGVGIDVTERRRTEEALRESEARFRLLFDAAPLPYQSLDADGTLVAVNDAWLATFGYRRADVLGRAFADFLTTAHVARAETSFARLMARGHLRTHFEMVRADGETILVAFDGRVARDAGGEFCQTHCIVVDVTERQRAVEALQRSDERYRTLSRTASSWAWTGGRDGSPLEPFDSFLDYTGLTAADVAGSSWLEAVHPADRETAMTAWAEAVRRAGEVRLEYRLRRSDGVYEWFSVHGSPVVDDQGRLVEYVGTSINVHERNLALEALRASEQRHRALFEQAPVGVFVYDRALHVTECNAELARMVRVPTARLLGEDLRVVAGGNVVEALEAALAGEQASYEGAFHVVGEGASLMVTLDASPLRAADGSVTGAMGVVADVTERHRFLDRIDRLAFTDLVTGLPNRTAFDLRLQEAITLAGMNCHKVALMVLNIDRFRHVYDSIGGRASDRLLSAVGARLTKLVETSGTVARGGGDEFLVLLPDIAGPDDIVAVSERVAAGFRGAVKVDGEPIYVQFSVGMALCPDDSDEPDILLRDATVAMRRAKRDGGGVRRLYDIGMDARLSERLALETELHDALDTGELEVHFQPLVRGAHAQVVGVEALVRWRHPRRGLLSPAEFIPMAEDTGLIVPMGEWVLAAACRQVKQWHDAGLAGLRLSVNLSSRQLGDDQLLAKVSRALHDSGLAACYLEIEITETAVMADAAQAGATVRELKKLGARVALDDFGTGYSSLSLLSSLAIDTVKVDRSFVAGMLRHGRDMTIVTSVVALGHRLGLNVVAEGVETREQFAVLREHGCDEMQGYLFARPHAAKECEALLRRRTLLD
jgi:diguanylate cyclase (GGDEF)-like protein/PAS domain S-box-containing protein